MQRCYLVHLVQTLYEISHECLYSTLQLYFFFVLLEIKPRASHLLGDHNRQACYHGVTPSALSSVFLENLFMVLGREAPGLMHARHVLCDRAAPQLVRQFQILNMCMFLK